MKFVCEAKATALSNENEYEMNYMNKSKRVIKKTSRVITRFESDLLRDLKDKDFRVAFETEKLRLEIALLLAEVRKIKNLSQKSMAEKVGTSQSAIARIESGRENFTIDTLGRIAAVLNRDVKISLV